MSSVLSLSPWPLRRLTTLAATLGLVVLGVWLAALLVAGRPPGGSHAVADAERRVSQEVRIAAELSQSGVQRVQQRSLVLASLAFAVGLAGLLLALTQRGWADVALAGAGLLWAVHFSLGAKWLLGLSPAASPAVLQAIMLVAAGLTGWYGLRLIQPSTGASISGRSAMPSRLLVMGAVLAWLLGVLGVVDPASSLWIVPVAALACGIGALTGAVAIARGPASALRSSFGAWLLAGLAAVAMGCGMYELWLRINSPVFGDVFWMAWLATRVVVLAVLALLVALRLEQLSRMLRQLGRSHRAWRTRLRDAQRDSVDLRDRLALRDRHETQRQQRDRLLRELHDELGHRWVMVQDLAQGRADPRGPEHQALQVLIDTSLIDLRLALESLEHAPRPLSDALRDLREQLQPVLQACGATLAWAMDPRAAMLVLPPSDTLQLLRMVREALDPTPARQGAALVFSLDVLDGETGRHVRLRIAELPAAAATTPATAARLTPGWSKLQRQATMLGAQLALEPGVAGQTGPSLELVMPLTGR